MWTVTILRPRQYTSFTGVTGMDIDVGLLFPKTEKKSGRKRLAREPGRRPNLHTISRDGATWWWKCVSAPSAIKCDSTPG